MHVTDKGIIQPEFALKWRQGFGTILAPINLAINDLFQDSPKWRDDISLCQFIETVKGYIATHTPNPRPNNAVAQRIPPQPKEYHKVGTSPPPSKTKINIKTTQESNLLPKFGSLQSWHRYIKKTMYLWSS